MSPSPHCNHSHGDRDVDNRNKKGRATDIEQELYVCLEYYCYTLNFNLLLSRFSMFLELWKPSLSCQFEIVFAEDNLYFFEYSTRSRVNDLIPQMTINCSWLTNQLLLYRGIVFLLFLLLACYSLNWLIFLKEDGQKKCLLWHNAVVNIYTCLYIVRFSCCANLNSNWLMKSCSMGPDPIW